MVSIVLPQQNIDAFPGQRVCENHILVTVIVTVTVFVTMNVIVKVPVIVARYHTQRLKSCV